MLQNSVRKGSPVLYALIFSLYMFEFQLFAYLEGTVNGVLSIGHYLTYILLSGGFILFGASRMMISGEKGRQLFLIMTDILFAAAILGIFFPHRSGTGFCPDKYCGFVIGVPWRSCILFCGYGISYEHTCGNDNECLCFSPVYPAVSYHTCPS